MRCMRRLSGGGWGFSDGFLRQDLQDLRINGIFL
jgi:hypothetical protein